MCCSSSWVGLPTFQDLALHCQQFLSIKLGNFLGLWVAFKCVAWKVPPSSNRFETQLGEEIVESILGSRDSYCAMCTLSKVSHSATVRPGRVALCTSCTRCSGHRVATDGAKIVILAISTQQPRKATKDLPWHPYIDDRHYKIRGLEFQPTYRFN